MKEKVLEQGFFFGLLALVGYLVWNILSPFLLALALSAIIASVCYPLYRRVLRFLPGTKKSIASLITTLIIFLIVVIPLGVLSYVLFLQAEAFYASVQSGKGVSMVTPTIAVIQDFVQRFAPEFTVDIGTYAQQGAGWITTSLGSIFASTASTLFSLLIAFIGLYYLFKDGELLVQALIKLSPLPDSADKKIIDRLSVSIRSVLVGRLFVGILQGCLTALGFWLFGIPQAMLWGVVTIFASFVPMVGTMLVFVPAVIFLWVAGSYGSAAGIALWGFGFVGLIDNILGPYMMSRGAALHPFLVLLAVLGGLSLFGAIGFILGPVVVTLFISLLEFYETYIVNGKERYGR